MEEVDSYYAFLDNEGGIVAGAGIRKDVVKCVAVDSRVRSGGLLAPLVSHIISVASSRGVTNLKVFTKPGNEGIFKSLGFHTVACAPKAIFMENGHGLEDYLRSLTAISTLAGLPSEPGRVHSRFAAAEYGLSPAADPVTGLIVMNANPFTLGHQYLVRKASETVDRLYVIPVKDDIPTGGHIPVAFPYEDRLAMIKAGCGSYATVLEGSDYQISDITFPTYFLKDLSDASESQIRLDLDLFGRHVAPALGVTVRFVGSEPSDPLTSRYNELMKEILPSYGISVVEIPRLFVDLAWSAPEFRPYSAAAKRGWTRPGSDGSQAIKQISASDVREALSSSRFLEAARLTPPTTWSFLMAELMARALRMELEAPHKPGLVDPCSNGAHSDMDYDLMKGSIEVIRRSFVRHLPSLMGMYSSLGEALTSFGKEIEADVLAFTGGINTYRGAIFSLGLTSIAALELASTAHHSESDTLHQGACGGQAVDYQSNSSTDPGKNGGVKTPNIFSDSVLGATASEGWFTPEELSEAIARLATGIEPVEGTHGARAVNEYAVKGALQMARDGYKPLFEDWLPFYRTTSEADPWRLQKTLLRIMSELDDTCVIHRVGYQRALEVKEESKRLLEGFTPEGLKEMKERYDAEGISPGGAADMLALTILVDSLLPRDGRQEATDDESDIKDI